eukprot:4888550-Alexandrium_andersonii.AAC.1
MICSLCCAALPPRARPAVPPPRRAVLRHPARPVETGLPPWHHATLRRALSPPPVPQKGPPLISGWHRCPRGRL